eukprot:Skav224161  [mRNA]  locus=scaffold2007:145872:149397:- [translate_table: standard]
MLLVAMPGTETAPAEASSRPRRFQSESPVSSCETPQEFGAAPAPVRSKIVAGSAGSASLASLAAKLLRGL